MNRHTRIARIALVVLGVAVALPVALTLASDVGSASGYLVASGLQGQPICNPGGPDDCPPS